MSLKALRWTKKYIAFSFLFVHSLSCCYLFAVFVFICSLSMHYCANRHEFISVFHLHQNHRSSGWQTCGKNRRCSCPHVWLFDCRALLRRFRLPCISLSIVSSWLVLDYFSLELSRSLFLHTHSPLLGLLRCSVKWSKAMPWWKRWKAWGARRNLHETSCHGCCFRAAVGNIPANIKEHHSIISKKEYIWQKRRVISLCFTKTEKGIVNQTFTESRMGLCWLGSWQEVQESYGGHIRCFFGLLSLRQLEMRRHARR